MCFKFQVTFEQMGTDGYWKMVYSSTCTEIKTTSEVFSSTNLFDRPKEARELSTTTGTPVQVASSSREPHPHKCQLSNAQLRYWSCGVFPVFPSCEVSLAWQSRKPNSERTEQ